MPIRKHVTQPGFGALVPGPKPEATAPFQLRPALDAAFGLENDVNAWWDVLTAPTFDEDPAFDAFKRTKESPYWENNRDSFVGAQSEEHWQYIAAKIEKENKAREVLGSYSPWVSIPATLAAGLASPTMLLPGLTPLRGMRGIAAAAGLGTLGAGLAEIPLQMSQETRTAREAFESLAAGTILGGLLGGAAQALRLPQAIGQVFGDVERAFENDMARVRGTRAIPEAAPQAAEVPPPLLPQLRIVDDITRLQSGARPVTSYFAEPIQLRVDAISTLRAGMDDAAFQAVASKLPKLEESITTRGYTPEPIKIEVRPDGQVRIVDGNTRLVEAVRSKRESIPATIEYLDGAEKVDGAFAPAKLSSVVQQAGPLIRAPSAQSAGAAAVPNLDPGGLSAGPLGRDISWLGKYISPVVQTIAQNEYPTLRRMMSTLSTAGLRLTGNENFIPARVGGTVEANIGLYDAFIAKLVQVQDEYYTKYMYEGAVRPPLASTRATLRSTFRFTGKKLTREEFNTEVSRAMFTGDLHPVGEVAEAAKLLRSEIYDPILEEAKATGLFEEGDLFDDASYLARMYDTNKIDANPEVFVQKLTAHFKKILSDEVAKSSDRLRAQKKLLDEYIQDANASSYDIEERYEAFKARLDELGESDEEAALTALRRERREIRERTRGPQPRAQREADKARLEEIKKELEAGEKAVGPRAAEKRGLRRRLRNLNRSFIAYEAKRAAKVDRIARTEIAALTSLDSVLARGRKLERDMAKLSDGRLLKEVNAYAMRWVNAEDALARHDARIEQFAKDGDMEGFTDYVIRKEDRMEELVKQIQEYADQYEYYKGIDEDKVILRELLADLATEANKRVNALNLSRGKRIAKLEADVAKLSPEVVAERVAAKQERFRAREADVRERFRAQGVDDFDFEAGNAAVDAIARSRAEEAVYKIGEYNNRVNGLHILGEERGSELARVLSIPSIEIFDFLITDIELVTRNYVRQVSADIELKRAFGDVDAKQWFKDAEEEFFRVQADLDARGASQEEKDASAKRHRAHIRNIAASISRLRHTWGIPENPNGFAARAGKVMLDLATLRFMGSVAISSVPDLGRLVVKHGLKRVYANALRPLIADFKNFKMSAREIKLAGGALDPILHSRAMAFAEILDENIGHSMPERVIHTLSTKMGLIAGFDYWTSAMKQMAGVLDVAQVMDHIDLLINGGGTADEIARATTRLAELGFNEDLARRVWDEVQAGGGGKVNGIWLPNTEDWADAEAKRAFRAAIRQANNNTIITPGLEIPLVANSSMAMRLLFQFKSFALASHTKSLMAGLQQKDMAIVNGMLSSLALGALSYYIWAQTVGGDAVKEMQEADLDRWLDEMIARAGFTGAFAEVQRIAERIPLTAPYANFSGERTTRRAGSSLVEALLGPSFDTANTTANVLAGIDDPTQATVRQFFDLLPFNNVFYLRQLFQMLEEGVGAELPERRGQ